VGRRLTSNRFVGRAAELRELELAAEAAGARKPGLVLLGGDSGVGKSRLVGELVRLLTASEVLVLRGEAVEQEDGELPYAPLTGALRPLARAGDPALDELGRGSRAQLAALLPGLDEHGSSPDWHDPSAQMRLFEALLDLLDVLSERQPMALILEDLHWADEGSLAMLHALAAAGSGREVWWLHGARNRAGEPFTDESRSLLAGLARGRPVVQRHGLPGAPAAAGDVRRLRVLAGTVGFLAVLATLGVFSLFAVASGILRLPASEAASPLIKRLVDEGFDAILVTDGDGRVLYANAAYLDLVGAADANDLRPVERVFIGDADASEAIYRLLKAAREGQRLQEEVRVAGIRGRPARWLRLRVNVRAMQARLIAAEHAQAVAAPLTTGG